MDEGRKELHKRILTNLFVTLAVIAAAFLFGPALIQFFMPLIVAWIIASLANPMVAFLEKKIHIMRKTGSALVIVFVILLIGMVLYLVIRFLMIQVTSLAGDLPEVYEQVLAGLENAMQILHEHFSFVPADLEQVVAGNKDRLSDLFICV